MIRRFGSIPKAGHRYIRRAGAYALLPRDGMLLLTSYSNPDPDIQLPGGGIDPGESPLMALHREVFEETGWHIAAPRRVGAFRNFTYMPEYDLWAEKICHIYIARPTRQMAPAPEIFHDPIWADPDTAARLLNSPGDRYFAGRFAQFLIR